jgi:hypothetical protein
VTRRPQLLRQPKRFRPVGESRPVVSQDRSDSPFSNLIDHEHASGKQACGRTATEISSVHAALKIRVVARMLVAGFRLCRSGEDVNDQLRTLDHRVDVMSV